MSPSYFERTTPASFQQLLCLIFDFKDTNICIRLYYLFQFFKSIPDPGESHNSSAAEKLIATHAAKFLLKICNPAKENIDCETIPITFDSFITKLKNKTNEDLFTAFQIIFFIEKESILRRQWIQEMLNSVYGNLINLKVGNIIYTLSNNTMLFNRNCLESIVNFIKKFKVTDVFEEKSPYIQFWIQQFNAEAEKAYDELIRSAKVEGSAGFLLEKEILCRILYAASDCQFVAELFLEERKKNSYQRYFKYVAIVAFFFLNKNYEPRSKCPLAKAKENLIVMKGDQKLKCADLMLGTGLFCNSFTNHTKKVKITLLAAYKRTPIKELLGGPFVETVIASEDSEIEDLDITGNIIC